MDKNELCRKIEQIYPDLLKRWGTHDLFCRVRFNINFTSMTSPVYFFEEGKYI